MFVICYLMKIALVSGQKGIGFKSVFRVTDTPHIHSGGFHLHFDVNSLPMGYILPHWVDEAPPENPDKWVWIWFIMYGCCMLTTINTLRPTQNGCHFEEIWNFFSWNKIHVYPKGPANASEKLTNR